MPNIESCGRLPIRVLTKLRLAVSFGGYYTSATEYVRAAKYCENQGLDSIWFADSQMINRDIYECMALCAAGTAEVRLGSAVTNPITRDISVTASAISTLNEISNGRAILGIGPGDSSVRRIGRSPATVKQLESEIAKVRKLCNGEPISSPDGEMISMRWSSGKIPIFVSGTGKKMLELAGRIGDGVIINVGTSEESLKNAVEQVQLGMSGRDVSRQFTFADLSFLSISENRKEAINAARPYVVWYWKNAPRLFELAGIKAENLDKGLKQVEQSYVEHDHIHTGDWSEAISRSSFITDEMVDRFTISGTPEDCVRKLKEKEKLGVELFIARHTGGEKDWLEFLSSYCENVLPNFR